MKNVLSKMLKATARSLPLYLFCFILLQGCGSESGDVPDQTDLRFASFYSEYLIAFGVPSGESGDLNAIGSGQIDSLFARHGLTRELFEKKLKHYAEHPKLWRNVLVHVRKNLRQAKP
jgi:hypothetical protein